MTGADIIAFAKKNPTGSVCAIIILLCGVVYYFRMDVAAASLAEYEARSGEAARMISNVKGAPGLTEQVQEIQQLSKELDARLVKAGQLAVNLQYFYKLEADNGVKLLDVRQNPVPPPGRGPKTSFTPVPFSLTVQGSYAQISKFLGQLQTGRHLCRITNATLLKTGGARTEANPLGDQDITLNLSVELLGQS